MKKIENDCVGCATYCINCGRKRAVHYYCDNCLEEEKLFEFEGQELCISCIERKLTVVEGSEF